jgi:hypothetical protein
MMVGVAIGAAGGTGVEEWVGITGSTGTGISMVTCWQASRNARTRPVYRLALIRNMDFLLQASMMTAGDDEAAGSGGMRCVLAAQLLFDSVQY